MSNMSYCRFRNTLPDLKDCAEAMYEIADGHETLDNDEEKRARKAILRICVELAEAFGHEVAP